MPREQDVEGHGLGRAVDHARAEKRAGTAQLPALGQLRPAGALAENAVVATRLKSCPSTKPYGTILESGFQTGPIHAVLPIAHPPPGGLSF